MLETPKIIKVTSSPQTPKDPCSSPKLWALATTEHHASGSPDARRIHASKVSVVSNLPLAGPRQLLGQLEHIWYQHKKCLAIQVNHTIRHMSLQEFLFSEVTHFALADAEIRWPSIAVSTPAGLLSLPGQPGHLKPQYMFKKQNQTKITTKKLN